MRFSLANWNRIHEHPMKGKRRSEEAKQKTSESLKKYYSILDNLIAHSQNCLGRTQSEETRRKIGLKHRGKTISKESRKKMSESRKRYFENPENRAKANKYFKGKKLTKEHIAKMLLARKGYTHSEETRKKISEKAKERYANGWQPHVGRRHSSEWCKHQSIAIKKAVSDGRVKLPDWSNPTTRAKMIKATILASHITPNRKERHLGQLIRLATGTRDYKFNAKHGFIIIDGLVPDFVNVNGQKKCIELFGDYWHNHPDPKKMKPSYTEQGRKEILARFGWDCLVIWEKELKEPEKVVERIKEFNAVSQGG